MRQLPVRDADRDRLLRCVDAFHGRRVAVLGDLVADEFFYGDIERVSREAPVLILRHVKTEVVPGGGGNAVANLRALDARPVPVGIVGRDDSGRRMRAAFRRLGITVAGIRSETGYATPTKSRVIAGGVHTRRQQMVRLDRGSVHGGLAESVVSGIVDRLRTALERAEGLLVADYGYGAANPEIVRAVLASRSGEIPVTVDSRARVAEYRGLTACTPNQEELERALRVPGLADDATLEKGGAKLLRRTGHRAVLVTRGSQGMSLFQRGRPVRHVPAFGSDEVADVTGAGDTVIAVFTLAVLCGASFEDAARLANVAAGLVVMKAGTATVGRDELREAISDGAAP
jgi:rfaE bifunctional protein kinase chain/domain